MSTSSEPLRIMLGFVVRQCAVALGRPPRPEEFAVWANNQHAADGTPYRIFGREITAEDARIIMRHPGRLVTVRAGERWRFATPASVGEAG